MKIRVEIWGVGCRRLFLWALGGVFFCLAPDPVFAASKPVKPDLKVDLVVVDKTKRTLSLHCNGKPLKTYKIALGPNPAGHKERQGDGRTPEGRYTIDYRNPKSSYHRSLHISYPNQTDVTRARQLGVSPGGDIMIHGLPNGRGDLGSMHRSSNWTEGCIAVTNEEIEEIWSLVQDGTPIQIRS